MELASTDEAGAAAADVGEATAAVAAQAQTALADPLWNTTSASSIVKPKMSCLGKLGNHLLHGETSRRSTTLNDATQSGRVDGGIVRWLALTGKIRRAAANSRCGGLDTLDLLEGKSSGHGRGFSPEGRTAQVGILAATAAHCS